MMLGSLDQTIGRAIDSARPEDMIAALSDARAFISGLQAAERGPHEKVGVRDFVREDFRQVLDDVGITSGRVAELGGPGNSFRDRFPAYEWEFLSIFPDPERPEVRLADITHCPQIPSESYDVIFSVSVMEHVARPWAAAREMRRILRPGGVVYHAAPFSYFFHGAPMDFWRYTPTAFEQLFEGFEVLRASFYADNRRRNNLGSDANPVDRDGGPQFAPDAFGGWRENWTTLFAAQKSTDAMRSLGRRRRGQLAVDVVALLQERGVPEDEIYDRAADLMTWIRINDDGEPRLRSAPGHRPQPEKVRSIWRHKRQRGLRPSANRAVLLTLLD